MTKKLVSNIIITILSAASVVFMGYPFYHIREGGINPAGNPVGLTVMYERWHAGFIFMWLMLIINIAVCVLCMLRIFTDAVSIKKHPVIKIITGTVIFLFTAIICFSNYSVTAMDLSHTSCGWAIYWFAVVSGLNGLAQFITYKM